MTTKRTATTKKAELAPAAPKSEPKTATKVTKSTKKTTAKKSTTAKSSDRAAIHAQYTAAKLKVQGKLKIGATMPYRGRNEDIDGKTVKVIAHEGRGGIVVQYKDEKYIVSPHSLLKTKQ